MKPRELLIKSLKTQFVPQMEALGFDFSERNLNISRSEGSFLQLVQFSLSRWNGEDDCTFWTQWSVRSSEYSSWYKKRWGVPPASSGIAGAMEWNIPEWSRTSNNRFLLTNSPSDVEVLEELVENSVQHGVNFLKAISSWEGAASWVHGERLRYDLAVDLLLLAGLPNQAATVLHDGLSEFCDKDRPDQLGQVEALNARRSEYSELQ